MDTPTQRDHKADVLAAEFRRFRWEVRIYEAMLMLFVVIALVAD